MKLKMNARKKRLDNLEDYQNRRRLMWVNDFIARPKVYNTIYIAICITTYLIINYSIKYFTGLTLSIGSDGVDAAVNGSLNPFTPALSYYYLYIIWLILLVVGYIGFCYKIRISFEQLNIGQKGTSRWTTRDELDAQYKLIPDSKERFSGGGGFPVARKNNGLYIDDSPVNNIIIGITRSGKGEIVVFPEIDIYSRAENQASMIIIDPKLELASASIPILTKRGYDCHILNLIDPEYSMGYNPLQLILEEYKEGHIDNAQLLCGAFCYSIFNPDQATGDSKFFEDNSTSLLTALILASIDDNLALDKFHNEKKLFEHNKKEIDRRNRLLSNFSNVDRTLYLMQERIREIRKYDPEINNTALASELDITIAELKDILQKTDIDIGFVPIPYVPTFPNEKNVNMFSIINTFSTLTSVKTTLDQSLLDEYFQKRPEGDTAKLLYTSTGVSGSKTKGSIYSNMLTALKIFSFDNIAKLTAESTLDVPSIGFGEKPIAIFIGVPDYDKSNYFLATAFIRQTYFTLAKMATHAPGEKCYREVVFILDEFGNIPPIENMSTIITVCLSRNIRFNLIIQSYQQIYNLYGDSSKTIIENCGNQGYILTNSRDTASEFSELLDTETITNVNRTGKMFSLNKERTEMPDENALMQPGELRRLMPGEYIVCRAMKRNQLDNKPVRPYPIANMGEHRMKYRYEYLLDEFPSDNILYDTPIMRKVYEMIMEVQKERIAAGYKEEVIEEPKVLDIEIENTSAIDPNSRLWPAEQFVNQYEAINKVFNQEQIGKIAILLNLDQQTVDLMNDGDINIISVKEKILKDIKNPVLKENAYLAWDMLQISEYEDQYDLEVDLLWSELKDISFRYPDPYIPKSQRSKRFY